jgi:hypothetical protein
LAAWRISTPYLRQPTEILRFRDIFGALKEEKKMTLIKNSISCTCTPTPTQTCPSANANAGDFLFWYFPPPKQGGGVGWGRAAAAAKISSCRRNSCAQGSKRDQYSRDTK